MSTNPSIFETFSRAKSNPVNSPFSVAEEGTPSPFTAVNPQSSPFKVVEEASNQPIAKADSPFQIPEPSEGYGFEPPARPVTNAGTSPFEAVAQPPARPSPFAPAQAQPSPFEPAAAPAQPSSPFVAPSSAQPAGSGYGTWPEPSVVPPAFQNASASVPPSRPLAAANPPAPAPTYDESAPFGGDMGRSDSYAIRQLELRAIFGVDREMNADEILQRSRSLPGMKNIARVGPNDVATIESLKQLLPNLGFGSGNLRIYTGSVPLEFIREGNVMLAVQTDGGFAPGVRETLMIVARELSKMS